MTGRSVNIFKNVGIFVGIFLFCSNVGERSEDQKKNKYRRKGPHMIMFKLACLESILLQAIGFYWKKYHSYPKAFSV